MERLNSESITSEEMGIRDDNSEWLGIPKSHLMECAGYSFAIEIVDKYNLKENSKVAIFCGTGNNGGDGFVVAKHLSSLGIKVLVILVGTPDNIRTKEAKIRYGFLFYWLGSLWLPGERPFPNPLIRWVISILTAGLWLLWERRIGMVFCWG